MNFSFLCIKKGIIIMTKARIEYVASSDKATLYTIWFEGKTMSEFADFYAKFSAIEDLREDLNTILLALNKIIENGVYERYFRPEGKMNDGVCALPIDSGKLRLYCNRLSQQILIAGNGGVKETKTYNENQELSNYVLVLQSLDKSIKAAIKKGDVIIEETELKGIDEKEFNL